MLLCQRVKAMTSEAKARTSEVKAKDTLTWPRGAWTASLIQVGHGRKCEGRSWNRIVISSGSDFIAVSVFTAAVLGFRLLVARYSSTVGLLDLENYGCSQCWICHTFFLGGGIGFRLFPSNPLASPPLAFPSLPSPLKSGSGGVTPGKFLKINTHFYAFWCILALFSDSLHSPFCVYQCVKMNCPVYTAASLITYIPGGSYSPMKFKTTIRLHRAYWPTS